MEVCFTWVKFDNKDGLGVMVDGHKFHLTYVERHDSSNDGCTHVLEMANGARADTSGKSNAMGVSILIGAVAICK